MMRWLCVFDVIGGVACVVNGIVLMRVEIDIASVAITVLGALGVIVGLAMVRMENKA